jgi:hypothetical protein
MLTSPLPSRGRRCQDSPRLIFQPARWKSTFTANGKYGGEPCFLPNDDCTLAENEDDGYILAFVHDEKTWESELQIVNAVNLQLEASSKACPPGCRTGFMAHFVDSKELVKSSVHGGGNKSWKGLGDFTRGMLAHWSPDIFSWIWEKNKKNPDSTFVYDRIWLLVFQRPAWSFWLCR